MGMWNRKRAECLIRSPAAGFTLLEVMVALAIVALVLVPLLRLHLLSLDATVRAHDLTTAVLLAQGHLAAMGVFPEPGEEEGGFDDPELAKYHWHTAVTEHTIEAENGSTKVKVRQIEVTVRWTDGQHERHYTLQAYASQ